MPVGTSQHVAIWFGLRDRASMIQKNCPRSSLLDGPQAPQRSTLSYANQHRPWQLCQKVFATLFGRCAQIAGARQRRFRFRNPLTSIDGTLMELCSSIYDWAKWQRAKGAAKLHMVLDHDGYLPRFAVMTEGKASEVKVARGFHFEPGTILVWATRACRRPNVIWAPAKT
jgi:hypothetical protein